MGGRQETAEELSAAFYLPADGHRQAGRQAGGHMHVVFALIVWMDGRRVVANGLRTNLPVVGVKCHLPMVCVKWVVGFGGNMSG